jgi:uncharacterized membrane protein
MSNRKSQSTQFIVPKCAYSAEMTKTIAVIIAYVHKKMVGIDDTEAYNFIKTYSLRQSFK